MYLEHPNVVQSHEVVQKLGMDGRVTATNAELGCDNEMADVFRRAEGDRWECTRPLAEPYKAKLHFMIEVVASRGCPASACQVAGLQSWAVVVEEVDDNVPQLLREPD